MENRPVLIIDDDPLFCEFVGAVLGKAGYEVLSALSASSGLDLARTARPAVIILDMVMPHMDGVVTCRSFKQDPVTRDIPVVGVTASLELRYADEAYRAGAEFFLTKPLAPDNLIYVVRMALERTRSHTIFRPRLYIRFRAHLPVWCTLRGEGGTTREVEGYTGDIGSAGVLIWLPEMVTPGTVFHIRLVLPSGNVSAEGQVIWKDYKAGSRVIPHGVRLVSFAREPDRMRYKQLLYELSQKGEM